jgi:hypothetical protein
LTRIYDRSSYSGTSDQAPLGRKSSQFAAPCFEAALHPKWVEISDAREAAFRIRDAGTFDVFGG